MMILQKMIALLIMLILTSSVFAEGETNGCGAQELPDFVPDAPLGVWLKSLGQNDIFGDACDTHDLCYGETDIPQETCDQQFLNDLLIACGSLKQEVPSFAAAAVYTSCSKQAQLYYLAVSELGYIAKEGSFDGKITQVEASRIYDWLGDDEFKACVTFFNNGTINGEYRIVLYGSSGQKIDTEPDSYWKDVITGESSIICVGTEWIYESISDIGNTFTVELHEQNIEGMVDSYSSFIP